MPRCLRASPGLPPPGRAGGTASPLANPSPWVIGAVSAQPALVGGSGVVHASRASCTPASLRGGLCDPLRRQEASRVDLERVAQIRFVTELEGIGQDRRVAFEPSVSSVGFAGRVARLRRDNTLEIEDSPPGPPRRIDGYTIGAVSLAVGPGPHLGEMHPDGDEFLHVVSGSVDLILDDGDGDTVGEETVVVLNTGDACVVPRGVWHRLVTKEPSRLIHVTPGPNGPARPLR